MYVDEIKNWKEKKEEAKLECLDTRESYWRIKLKIEEKIPRKASQYFIKGLLILLEGK